MENCSICTSAIKNDCTLPCNHSFCAVCIATWFTRSTSCPLCRHDCSEWTKQWAQQIDSPLLIQIYHRFPGAATLFDQDDGPPPLLDDEDESGDEYSSLSFFSSQNPIVTFQPSPTETRHPSQEPGPVPLGQNTGVLGSALWAFSPIPDLRNHFLRNRILSHNDGQEASDPMVQSEDEDDVENYRAMWNDIGQLLNYVQS